MGYFTQSTMWERQILATGGNHTFFRDTQCMALSVKIEGQLSLKNAWLFPIPTARYELLCAHGHKLCKNTFEPMHSNKRRYCS